MMEILQYPIGFFINIGAPETYSALVPQGARGKLVCFAVYLADGKTIIVEEHS